MRFFFLRAVVRVRNFPTWWRGAAFEKRAIVVMFGLFLLSSLGNAIAYGTVQTAQADAKAAAQAALQATQANRDQAERNQHTALKNCLAIHQILVVVNNFGQTITHQPAALVNPNPVARLKRTQLLEGILGGLNAVKHGCEVPEPAPLPSLPPIPTPAPR